MSKESAMQIDTIRRLGLSTVELHVIKDPKDLFALAIAVYDPWISTAKE
ncbi:MAG: hypothetical protein VW684_15575 [Betaproteobacteria bacterium]